MYYEYLYAISCLDWLSELHGIWDSYVQYGLVVFRYWYSDMMRYDNSIFNISASMFSILVFRYRVFWWNHHVKLSEKTFNRVFRLFDVSVDIALTYSFATILRYENWFDKNYIEIDRALGCRELHRPKLG